MEQDTIDQEENLKQDPEETHGASPESAMPGTEASDPLEPNSSPTSEQVSSPNFVELDKNSTGEATPVAEINRLHEVKVTVSAELGRTSIPIQELLKLTEGSVVELNRNIESPVELIAQGLPLANGEVVVVDEKFAIRIKEVYSNS